MIEFTAEAAAVARITERAARFNRKAEKLGLEVRATPVFSAPYTKVEKNAYGEVAFTLVDVTIPEVEIRLPGGFRFVAVIDHLDEGNFIARSPFATEVEIPETYRTTAATCDHCGLARNRTHTIIVVSEAGEFKQVGGQCAQSYLGIPSSTLVALQALLENLEDDAWEAGGNGGEHGWSLGHFLSTTAAAIKLYGWTSSTAAREYETLTATADVVKTLASRPSKQSHESYPEFYRLTTEEEVAFDAEAAAAVEWLAEQDTTSDYMWNLTIAVKSGFVTYKRAGIVASLIAVYQRAMNTLAEREAQAKLPASEFVGQVGDKVTATVQVVYTTNYFSDFGTVVFAILVDQVTGETYQVKTGVSTKVGSVLDTADRGDEITVKGTVKEHRTDDKGRKATVLTRAALV